MILEVTKEQMIYPESSSYVGVNLHPLRLPLHVNIYINMQEFHYKEWPHRVNPRCTSSCDGQYHPFEKRWIEATQERLQEIDEHASLPAMNEK